jgi:hypothetical protein
MAQEIIKLPARNTVVKVKNQVGTMVEVKGANSITVNRTLNTADTTSFDEQGWMSSFGTSKTFAITLEGFMYVDPVTGLQDEGQQLIEDSVHVLGIAGLREYEVTIFADEEHTTPLRTISMKAHATPSDNGGGIDDATSWGNTLQASGKVTTVNNKGNDQTSITTTTNVLSLANDATKTIGAALTDFGVIVKTAAGATGNNVDVMCYDVNGTFIPQSTLIPTAVDAELMYELRYTSGGKTVRTLVNVEVA